MTFWVALIAVMTVVIFVALLAILARLGMISSQLQKNAENDNILYRKLEEVEQNTAHKSGVTDPFAAANKSHTPAASSKHIIVRKSPDQIRAEHAEEIKNGGKSYGSPV